MHTLNYLQNEKNKIQKQMNTINQQIANLPEGNLLCIRNGKYTKWMLSNGSSPIHIPKSNREYAQKLALRKYLSCQVEELTHKLKIIEKCISSYGKIIVKSSSFLENPYYHELISSYFSSYPGELNSWINADYEKNPSHPENLIHHCLDGTLVRSKSEVIIANALYTNKIPYRYECALYFDNLAIFPDFTICHPRTMAIVYWEHFGMMDNNSYADNAYNKLKIYGNKGIIPSINLITTFETKTSPINSEKINKLIHEHFL